MDIVHRLNAELGLDNGNNNGNEHKHIKPAAVGKKLRLPLQLEEKGYKALRLIGEGAYGKALLVSTDGSTSVTAVLAKQQQQRQEEDEVERKGGGLTTHPLAPSETRPVPSLIIIKHINMTQYTRQERLASKNEINFLKKLNHPHIIRYIDSIEDGPNDLYILMEFADCGDLETKCKKGKRLEEKEILTLFAQIVDAVGHMHSLKVLHRDLKPQNVFMSGGGSQVKIGDFGISKSLHHTKAMAHTVCGTPYYFSPELCKGRPYNAASDVWALGVMLYEMLTRKMPFDARNMTQLMTAICSSSITRRPELANDNVWALISAMLSRDPAKRPDCGAILLHPALRGLTSAMNTNANGVLVLPVPTHMSMPRRLSTDLPAPLPLASHQIPCSSLALTPVNSRNPSPAPTPRLGALVVGDRDRVLRGEDSPAPHSRVPLPIPIPSAVIQKVVHLNQQQQQQHKGSAAIEHHAKKDHGDRGGGGKDVTVGGRNDLPSNNEVPRPPLSSELPYHLPNLVPLALRTPAKNVAMNGKLEHKKDNNNKRQGSNAPATAAVASPNSNQNMSPNYDNNRRSPPEEEEEFYANANINVGDEDGCLLRQQEAALIRARLAAKNEEYYFNRARQNARNVF